MTFFNDINVLPIVYELLQNLALLYTFISLFMPMVTKDCLNYNPLKIHTKGVLFFSALALLSMLMPIRFTQIPDAAIDLRIAILILASSYLGPINAFWVGGVTIVVRIFLGGLGWIPWVPAALISGPVAFAIIKQVSNRPTGIITATITCTAAFMTILAIISHDLDAFSYFSPSVHPDNFIKIFFALAICNSMAAVAYDQAIKNILSRQQNYHELRLKADTDGMTGLYNHNRFQYELDQALDSAQKSKRPLCLLMLDLDYFKEYNDNHGHQAGDALLKEAGRIFLESTRPQDIVARYGGEEFAIILPDCSEYEALKIAERIRVKFEQKTFYGREKMPKRKVTISIGIACSSGDSTDKDTLIQKADVALYSVKRSGRNKSVVYSPYKNLFFMAQS